MDERDVPTGANVLMAPAPTAVTAATTSSSSLSTPSSPMKGATLLQRQVSRALEMIELYDGAAAAALFAAAHTTDSIATSNNSAPTTAAAATAHVPCRVHKALNKKMCPKAVFQISPNAVKRKRSHSMSSISGAADHASADSFRASIELAGKLSQSSSGSNGSASSSAGSGSATPVSAHKRSNTGSSAKKARDARVTPSKRCAGKSKDKTKHRDKADVIEHALQQLRAERLDATTAAAHSFEFTSICHSSSCTEQSTSVVESDRSADAASRLRVHVGVAAAQGARAYMEDRFSVVARLFDDGLADPASAPSLLAVYDGHNGALAAEFATTRFRELLSADAFLRDVSQRAQQHKLSADDIAQIELLLCDAFAVVDDEVLELTMSRNKRDGSTVLLGLLVGGKLFVANLGDSRGVWCKPGDDVERVSVDHKPDLDDESQRVEDAGGKVIFSGCWRVAHDEIPLRLAISRSLGDHPLKTNLPLSCSAPLVSVTPDIRVLDVGGTDEFLVFATDGLWDRLSDEDAAELVRAKVDEYRADAAATDSRSPATMKAALRFAADALVEAALQKRSMDNITAMVISWTLDGAEAFSAAEVADASDSDSTNDNADDEA